MINTLKKSKCYNCSYHNIFQKPTKHKRIISSILESIFNIGKLLYSNRNNKCKGWRSNIIRENSLIKSISIDKNLGSKLKPNN